VADRKAAVSALSTNSAAAATTTARDCAAGTLAMSGMVKRAQAARELFFKFRHWQFFFQKRCC
jgi:hypothetical protein